MTPELKQAIVNFLVIALTVAGAALTNWWQNKKTRKDVDALADKQRAAEREAGIETRWDPRTRGVHVTRISNGKTPHSQDPQRLDQGPGPG